MGPDRLRAFSLQLLVGSQAEDSAAIERALRRGDPFLAKPFTVGTLARQVRDVLDRSG